ncbi:pyrophosphatase [Myxococcus llanfairpwllgwyngyllgogerychwyrndrobwllllantysiliogogogochensis]|uniref:pyrophosphatase n=1 Tax=Myxococcus llanfairpwllgwyngyllgogerychwyrndrobwllllantysiliogogogochensis TaxID=2590453 RepID=UPI0015F11EC6|nr:pyrophosphatase [Myxococcus llanfairpwllgwyngyllgogerychwyrndrobwllllantysiliogogogochensis]
MNATRWLPEFAATAAKTDHFAGKSDHAALLAAGMIGEAGSVVAELKKKRRERDAYPVYHEKMVEEVGDFLWYFVRLVAVVAPGLLDELQVPGDGIIPAADGPQLMGHLDFGAAVGEVLAAISSSNNGDAGARLRRVWALLTVICHDAEISLRAVAERNTAKTRSRWPDKKQYAPLFDDGFSVEEQLPRRLRVDFLERARGTQRAVILRCNDINFGDRLTDNIEDPDGYRFHDIFHFSYAVHLGWSPVVRALMRTKRKSNSKIDEAQDGARAGIIEEAVSAIVFSRAKQLKFFEGLDHVDLDLLKTVKEFVEGFEVEAVPLWQWETAILDGYRVFRELCAGPGGRVTLDLIERRLSYIPHAANEERGKGLPSPLRGTT